MPLKLEAPRQGRTPNYRVRGTYLGKRVDRSAGTGDKTVAQRVLRNIQKQIERGEFSDNSVPNFAGAAAAYMKAGRDNRFLAPLIRHFGQTPIAAIGQAEIDEAASTLYPRASAATWNRQVYTPASAVLTRAGVVMKLKRPEGAQGNQRTQWLWPEEAERFVARARAAEPEFGAFLAFLLYTGLRLGEALGVQCRDVRLDESYLYVKDTKNGEPRAVHLTPYLTAIISAHPRGFERSGKLWRFTKGRYLYALLAEARTEPGLEWVSFHSLRHTWATWMRRYAGLDTRGLVATGAWKDQKSARRYEHTITAEEARKADLLPTPKPAQVVQDVCDDG